MVKDRTVRDKTVHFFLSFYLATPKRSARGREFWKCLSLHLKNFYAKCSLYISPRKPVTKNALDKQKLAFLAGELNARIGNIGFIWSWFTIKLFFTYEAILVRFKMASWNYTSRGFCICVSARTRKDIHLWNQRSNFILFLFVFSIWGECFLTPCLKTEFANTTIKV